MSSYVPGLLDYGTHANTTNLMITAVRLLGSKCGVVRDHNINYLFCQPSESSLAGSVFGDPIVERHHI